VREVRVFRNMRLGMKTLMLHKLRSLLTMLGVVFGVGSVIAMLAVGEGASQEALDQIRKLGSHNIIVDSVKPVEEQETQNVRIRMSIYGMLYNDEQRIAESFPTVKRTVVRRPVIAGRVLLAGDVKDHANAVVLTEYGARRLLATESTIGKTLSIGGDVFEVVGIVKSESGAGGGMQTPDRDTDAYIPLTTARERYGDVFSQRSAGTEIRELVELHHLIAEIDSIDNVEATATAIEAMLKRFHKKVDYRINVPLALLRQAEATKRTFNIVCQARHRRQAAPDHRPVPGRDDCTVDDRGPDRGGNRPADSLGDKQDRGHAHRSAPLQPGSLAGNQYGGRDCLRYLPGNARRAPRSHSCAPARMRRRHYCSDLRQ